MPYEWIPNSAAQAPQAPREPIAELHLWPYRSLPRKGFVIFIGITCALISVPLLSVLGSPVLWGVLPFLVAAVGGLWMAIQRNYRDGTVLERLRLTADHLILVRDNPHGPRQEWEANPFWVEIELHETGGPVEYYLTLRGNGREVELGAFLSPEERQALYPELSQRIRGMNAPR